MKRSNYKPFEVRVISSDLTLRIDGIDPYDAAKAFSHERKIAGNTRLEVKNLVSQAISLIDVSTETVVRYNCKDVE